MSEDDGEGKSRDGWLKVMLAGAIVAAVTGTFPLAGSYLGEDVSRCGLSVQFLVGFDNGSLYTEEELARIKAVFVDMAEANCPEE